ncbi:acyl--CoA ligase [Frankia sp. CNm7]|uniref:Acyl--CoA ligase n=1 Tax=Frankia nepalensis TaxID=1836974 RepID=A0A937RBF9_9ACTN|nr:class I adenylate-forming enzyme family protein [Frankia nepalensis]MBL7496626.1 acyl--CoA ligase [Frankia nepalensis]MBL7511884.1 acyl--CoA ligase [Frankia nepalensis]MBL7516635.1 acyl--CoA ligase [Frankia nepalensis]MBL7627365.1 acyl--CoA ligase [Frankia nepalensis]
MSLDIARNALLQADHRLTGPGGPFEVTEDLVLGERMPVFRNRPTSLREILASSACFGSRDCFVFGDGSRITFAELPSRVASTAAFLRDVHGVRQGDRVAICAANGPGWLLVLWATTSLGAVLVAMNGWWSEPEIENALDLTSPAVVFADEKRGARLPCSYVDVDKTFGDMIRHAPDAPLPDCPVSEDDPAALIFTSGTTGRPKAACLSHRSLVAFIMMQEYLGVRGSALRGGAAPARPATRLAVFPLFHVSGLAATLTAVHVGATTVWPLGRFDPGMVIDLTVREGINIWGGTVTHIFRLLQHPRVGEVDPKQIASVGIGGSATTPQLVRIIEERFPHLAGTSSSGYGSTESGGLISWTPEAMLAEAPDCVGPVLPTVEVRIADDRGDPVSDGHDGDIWVRSPLLMIGYWNNDEANAEALAPGRWLRTGDYGRLEHGVLFLASRRRDLIIRGGENVYPFEIENRLEEHPDIIEAAVIGVDDDEFGQEVKAVVVLREGSSLDAAGMRSHCATTLASYKVPTRVEIRHTALPRNPTGKVMKQVLAGLDAGTFVDDGNASEKED